jgi:hypothetical protein
VKIESVEVIPMSKESKWEDLPSKFEVAYITTSFEKWYVNLLEQGKYLDAECIAFAKAQPAFMTAPTGIFDKQVYSAKARSAETLDGLVLDGPLYRISIAEIDDTNSEKSIYRKYVDPNTFEPKEGFWYSKKKVYKIRYGTTIV